MRRNNFSDVLNKVPGLLEGKKFLFALGLVLLLGLILRVAYLDADPPLGITRSQDFSTDPFSYNMFAENKVDYGNANPLNDQRWILYERSTQTLAALAVYTVAGTGRAAGNFVAVLLNLLAITLIALGIKNFGSRIGAVAFALIAAASYIVVFFGRTPFLEASQNFWLSAAFFFFSLGNKKTLYYALAGVAGAAAAFFGKMLALGIGGVYIAAFLVLFFVSAEERKNTIRAGLIFCAGYLAVALFWLFFSYLPFTEQVKYYLQEQGLGLYGAPRGFQDLQYFLWHLISLLWESEFVQKLPFVVLLGAVSGTFVLFSALRSLRERKMLQSFNVGWLILLLWFVFGYLTLFPWNYRPLRYQTTLMFPLIAMAGFLIAIPWDWVKSSEKRDKKSRTSSNVIYFVLICGLFLMPLLGAGFLQLTASGGTGSTRDTVLNSVITYSLLFFGIGVALVYLTRWLGTLDINWRKAGQFASAVLLVTIVIVGLVQFANWAKSPQYSLITADRDLAAILNKDAVLSGSYAVALTLENQLKNVHHMFSLKYDPNFFAAYPITHLIMDEGNEKAAREQYPDVMNRAEIVARYFVRGFPVKLFRVTAASPNAEARNYQPSDFERAQVFTVAQQADSAEFYMRKYLDRNVPNYSANLLVGDALYAANQYERAIESYHKVQAFSPGDGLSAVNMGNCFLNLGSEKTNAAYFDSALVYLEIAGRSFPNDQRLADMINQLERRKQ